MTGCLCLQAVSNFCVRAGQHVYTINIRPTGVIRSSSLLDESCHAAGMRSWGVTTSSHLFHPAFQSSSLFTPFTQFHLTVHFEFSSDVLELLFSSVTMPVLLHRRHREPSGKRALVLASTHTTSFPAWGYIAIRCRSLGHTSSPVRFHSRASARLRAPLPSSTMVVRRLPTSAPRTSHTTTA